MILFLIVISALLVIVLTASFVVYRRSFYTPVKHQNDIEYLSSRHPFAVTMKDKTEELMKKECEMVYIESDDGLRLEGRYYASSENDAPTAVLFHGYRGVCLIDMSGVLPLFTDLGFNVLLISERGCMGSGGHTVTFGIKETGDALRWVDYVRERNGEDAVIYLMGISMGAHTVLNTADKLGEAAVRGIIADCPYTSSRAIIDKVLRSAHFPPCLLGWFVNLTTSLWGGFLLSRSGAVESVKKSSVPVLLIHGTGDRLVPFSMSEEIKATAPSRVTLVSVKDAPHAESFIYDREKYEKAVRDFVSSTI